MKTILSFAFCIVGGLLIHDVQVIIGVTLLANGCIMIYDDVVHTRVKELEKQLHSVEVMWPALKTRTQSAEASVDYWKKVAEEAVARLQAEEAMVAQLVEALRECERDAGYGTIDRLRGIEQTAAKALSSTPPLPLPATHGTEGRVG